MLSCPTPAGVGRGLLVAASRELLAGMDKIEVWCSRLVTEGAQRQGLCERPLPGAKSMISFATKAATHRQNSGAPEP